MKRGREREGGRTGERGRGGGGVVMTSRIFVITKKPRTRVEFVTVEIRTFEILDLEMRVCRLNSVCINKKYQIHKNVPAKSRRKLLTCVSNFVST